MDCGAAHDAAPAVVDNALTIAVKSSRRRIPAASLCLNHALIVVSCKCAADYPIRLIEDLKQDRSVYSHRASHKQTSAFRFTRIILHGIW